MLRRPGNPHRHAAADDGGRWLDAASDSAQQQQAPPVVIQVDSLLMVKGRVKMLRLLTHRVQGLRVAVSPIDGRVLRFRC
ncbi:unnamed protein product [Urochloa humidicola]